MSDGYTMWAPTKPEDQFEDEEIRDTDIFKRLKQNTSVSMGNSTVPGMKDEALISITRDTIREMWNTLQITRYTSKGNAFFEALEEDGIDHGNEIILMRDENGIVRYKLLKGQGRRRFSHANYTHFIGRGTLKDSDLYREAVRLLREKCDLDESALHGGFLLVKTQMRSDNKNGIFELVLEKGKEGNSNTDKFSAKLYQFPFVKQAIPTIVFPPLSGEKGKNAALRVTDTEQEVGSMSSMLKSAIVKGAQTPAVVFGLVDLLKSETGNGDAVADSDSKDYQESNDEPAAVAPTVSAAHALLDDDDDE